MKNRCGTIVCSVTNTVALQEEDMTGKGHIQNKSPDALVSLSTAAKLCPGRPNASTLWRWARKGIKARSGARIRLEHKRVGGKIFVTLNSLDRFFGNVAAADIEHFERQSQAESHFRERTIRKPSTRSKRDSQIQKAEAFLREEGL
jgi:hypothetical protein